MADRLRLRAEADDGLEVIAACLQDAILPVADIRFDRQAGLFLAVANRYCWEDAAARQRIHCGLEVHGVTAVRQKNIDLSARDRLLSLLTLQRTQAGLHWFFAGGGELLLTGALTQTRLADFGAPWPALAVPRHDDRTQ
jgi:hypothetical protein